MSRMCHLMDSLPKFNLHYSHRKLKDSLEKQAVLLIFLLELKIFWGDRTRNIPKQRKMTTACENFLSFLNSKKGWLQGYLRRG